MTSISTAGGGIKSIQRGQTDVDVNTTGSISITSIDLAKTIVNVSWRSGYGTYLYQGVNSPVGAYLSNATTLSWGSGRVYTTYASDIATLYWEVVEYA